MKTNLTAFLQLVRDQHQKIVLVTGVFDVLHQEHHNFLEKAKAVGDVLIVGLESDVRVRQMKGESRPIFSQEVRRQHLAEWELADLIFILPEHFGTPADHEKLISDIKPNVLAVSSHSPHLEAKQRILAKYGGEVRVVYQHNPELSSTILIGKATKSLKSKEKRRKRDKGLES